MSNTDDTTDDAPTTVIEHPEPAAEAEHAAAVDVAAEGSPWWMWAVVCLVALGVGGACGWALASAATDPQTTELKHDLEEAEAEIEDLEDAIDKERERADAAEAEAAAATSAAGDAEARVEKLEAAARARDGDRGERSEPAPARTNESSSGIGAAKPLASYSVTLTSLDASDNPVATFEISNGGDEAGAPLCDGVVSLVASNGTSYPAAGNFDGGACSSVLPGTSRSATIGFNAPAGVTPARVSVSYAGAEAVWSL